MAVVIEIDGIAGGNGFAEEFFQTALDVASGGLGIVDGHEVVLGNPKGFLGNQGEEFRTAPGIGDVVGVQVFFGTDDEGPFAIVRGGSGQFDDAGTKVVVETGEGLATVFVGDLANGVLIDEVQPLLAGHGVVGLYIHPGGEGGLAADALTGWQGCIGSAAQGDCDAADAEATGFVGKRFHTECQGLRTFKGGPTEFPPGVFNDEGAQIFAAGLDTVEIKIARIFIQAGFGEAGGGEQSVHSELGEGGAVVGELGHSLALELFQGGDFPVARLHLQAVLVLQLIDDPLALVLFLGYPLFKLSVGFPLFLGKLNGGRGLGLGDFRWEFHFGEGEPLFQPGRNDSGNIIAPCFASPPVADGGGYPCEILNRHGEIVFICVNAGQEGGVLLLKARVAVLLYQGGGTKAQFILAMDIAALGGQEGGGSAMSGGYGDMEGCFPEDVLGLWIGTPGQVFSDSVHLPPAGGFMEGSVPPLVVGGKFFPWG